MGQSVDPIAGRVIPVECHADCFGIGSVKPVDYLNLAARRGGPARERRNPIGQAEGPNMVIGIVGDYGAVVQHGTTGNVGAYPEDA